MYIINLKPWCKSPIVNCEFEGCKVFLIFLLFMLQRKLNVYILA